MDFKTIFKAMKNGAKVKLPSWGLVVRPVRISADFP